MVEINGIELAQAIQKQNRKKFSQFQIVNIDIRELNNEPELIIEIQNKLNQKIEQLILIAERQETNRHNVHLTLFNDQKIFSETYKTARGNYVNANHQLAERLKHTNLVPENLYVIQDADGRPGIDFIKIDSFIDALNTLMLISELFQSIIEKMN